MVVTGIFIILTGIVLANNTRFGNVIVLQNLAHDIALSIRQAQVYGIAVRRCDPTVTNLCAALDEQQFNVAYGMHFCAAGSGSCTGNSFELFVDVDNNATYDPGETVLANTIAPGYRIDDLCTVDAATEVETCGLDELNVAFRRPEPDACIEGDFVDLDGPPGGDEQCVSTVGRARIIVKSARDDRAEIIVERTGQISAQ